MWCTGVASRAVRAGSINRILGKERLKIVDFWVLANVAKKELDLWERLRRLSI